MRLATIAQAKKIDERTQLEAKLSAELLMESAGCLAARECLQSFLPETQTGRIAILCGPGNNGADGLVMARHLATQISAKRIAVFILAPAQNRSALFNLQLARLHAQGIDTHHLDDAALVRDKKLKLWKFQFAREKLDLRITDFALWVEALFGVGFKGALEGVAANWIEAINQSPVQRLTLDTPVGLNADTGVVSGVAFRAHRTFTFGCLKAGFTVNVGPQHTGHVRVLNPGFPTQILRSSADTHLLVTRSIARKLKPARPASGNKTKFGHAVVFAGHDGLWGAGVLSATAAYRVGCGYVSLASFDDPSVVVNQHPEILTVKVDSPGLWQDTKWKVAAVGPGLGTGPSTLELLQKLIKRTRSGQLDAVVVDADAITVASREKLFPLPESWIMTPHAGELARILLSDPNLALEFKDSSNLATMIENDRFRFAKMAAKIAGCWILLKGFRTVLTHAENDRYWVIGSGNAALAKAGTGDVLTGFIVGLLSQKLSSNRAVCLGAFLHGLIADEWVSGANDIRSLESSDLIRRAPDTLSRL